VTKEMSVLVANRLADVAIGHRSVDATLALATEPIFKYRLVVSRRASPGCAATRASGCGSSILRDRSRQRDRADAGRLRIHEDQVRVPEPDRRWRRRPTARAWHPRSSTLSPNSCAAASFPA